MPLYSEHMNASTSEIMTGETFGLLQEEKQGLLIGVYMYNDNKLS